MFGRKLTHLLRRCKIFLRAISTVYVDEHPKMPSGEQDQAPDAGGEENGHEYGGRSQVLGPGGEIMRLIAESVHGCLDCAVDQFNHQQQEDRAQEQGPFDSGVAKPQTERDGHQDQEAFLLKRGFLEQGEAQSPR